MEAEELVHGDLRANNVMVKVNAKKEPAVRADGSLYLMLVDFEWSGKAAEVYYPGARNDEIKGIKWPAEIGRAIEQGHDRALVESWWPSFLST